MADENDGTEITVTVDAPPAEPETESPAVVVVGDTGSDAQETAVIDHAERIAVVESQMETLRAEAATATATAEIASEIALDAASAADEAAEPEPVIVEQEPEPEPEPDVEPNREHFWFRKHGH